VLREGESVKECEREREETYARWRGVPDGCLERKRMESTFAYSVCSLPLHNQCCLYILLSNLCRTLYRLRSTLNSLQSNLDV
jgi:hypothetical protein